MSDIYIYVRHFLYLFYVNISKQIKKNQILPLYLI